jgi:hypothetical protein
MFDVRISTKYGRTTAGRKQKRRAIGNPADYRFDGSIRQKNDRLYDDLWIGNAGSLVDDSATLIAFSLLCGSVMVMLSCRCDQYYKRNCRQNRDQYPPWHATLRTPPKRPIREPKGYFVMASERHVIWPKPARRWSIGSTSPWDRFSTPRIFH